MARFIIVLVFSFLMAGCAQPVFRHTVQSESYALIDASQFKNKRIFVDPSVTEEDLSKLPFLQNMKKELVQNGYTLVPTPSQSDLIMKFDIGVSRAIPFAEQGTETVEGSQSTEVKTGSENKEEIVVTIQPELEIPYWSQTTLFEKRLILFLRTTADNSLIWQSEARVLDETMTYAPFANTMVREAMRSFMSTSERLPFQKRYGLLGLKRVKNRYSKSR